MRIAVCVKRVPSTDTRVRIAPDGRAIDPEGVEWIVNPYDEFGIEEALQLREAKGEGGEVVIVSAGPPEASAQIRSGLALGADRGILVKLSGAPDPFTTAVALSAALKDLAPDLIFFGNKAVDDDAGQVPAYVATALALPLVTMVVKLETGEGKLSAHRQVDGGIEVVESPLPAAITCQKGLNVPRFASLPNIMKAKKKPIEEYQAPSADLLVETVKLEPPAARAPGRIVGTGVAAVAELVRLLKEEAKVI